MLILRDIHLFFCLVGLLFLGACSGPGMTSSYSKLYDIDSDFGHDFFVIQETRDSAEVFVQIATQDLLGKRLNGESDFNQGLLAKVLSYNRYQGLSDTMKFAYRVKSENQKESSVMASFKMPLSDTARYDIQVILQDEFRQREINQHRFLTEESYDSRYVSIKVNSRQSPFCACAEGDELEIGIYGGEAGVMNVGFYGLSQGLPPPTYSLNQTPAPELESEKLLGGFSAGEVRIPCPGKGLLLMEHEDGAVMQVPVFGPDYPLLENHEQLLQATRYIMSRAEYLNVLNSGDTRKGLEDFWLDIAGSHERARVLMAKYYERVEEANRYFTVYSEGWKSDRGMVHIVYGPPDLITRFKGREEWSYGSGAVDNLLRIIFYDEEGQYVIDRSSDYRQSWFLNKDAWRNGRISTQ